MFLEKDDGLRSVTLVARDTANLCTALCAKGADAAELWRTLAYTAVDSRRYSAVTPVDEGAWRVLGLWVLGLGGCWVLDLRDMLVQRVLCVAWLYSSWTAGPLALPAA